MRYFDLQWNHLTCFMLNAAIKKLILTKKMCWTQILSRACAMQLCLVLTGM